MGGATISFINLISGIKKMGVDIYVIMPHNDEVFRSKTKDIVSEYYVIPVASSILLSIKGSFGEKIKIYVINLLRKIWLRIKKKISLYSLIKISNKLKPDIIHTNTGIVHEGFFCAQLLGIPHIWHLREYQDLDFRLKILPSKDKFKKYLKDSYVISITKGIHSAFDLKDSIKHRVIYNGILSRNLSISINSKDKIFICASRISPEKGHEDVIKCFSEFYKSYPDFRLIIMGFGEEGYINYLKQLSKRLQCNGAVEFAGYKDNVLPYLMRGLALIVASYNEGFGRMTAESCFLGTLVIGRATGGTAEILDETGGLKFNSNEELLKMMIKVAEMDDDEYKRITEFAQNKAISLYSIEKNIDSTFQFYKDILSNNTKRSVL